MKRFIISILALTIILLLTGTCKREYVEFQKSDIPETTKVISDDVWVELIRAIDTTDYTFSFEQNPGVTEGDILVSSFDGGYLRRVTAIKQEGDAIIVETEFASLTDVVSEGQTSFNSVLSLQKVGRINYLKEGMVLDTTLMKSTENTPLEYDIDVYLDPQQKIHIQGHFSLLTDLNGEIEIKFIPPRISYFELTYNIDQNLDLAADIELMDNNYNKEIGLANITFQPIIAMLSGVPVVLVPELEIIAGIESSVDCHVYSSLTQHMDYTMGIVYEDRQWNTINELNKSFDFSPPQLSCNAAAKAYIKPQFNIKIYDVVSPYLYADLYGNIEADLQSSPWWNLYAGADIGIGIKAVILGHEIFDFNTNPPLIQFEQLIASATSHNTPPTALFTVSPTSGTTSTNFAFDASGSTDNETPTSQLQVRWDFDGNGSWDTNWDTDKTQNHQYSTEATYNAKLEVKDNEGLTDQYTKNITVSNGGSNTPPTALFTVSPTSGTTSTNFAFDASGSTDNETPTSQLQVRWDFDGNGSWDTNWDTDKTQNHQYSSEATYTAKLEVKDTEGLTDQYTRSITVSNGGGGTTGTFTDPRDGKVYQTVTIGTQVWMAENLAYLPSVVGPGTGSLITSYYYVYGYDGTSVSAAKATANYTTYGVLYNWPAAINACPTGWHLPSDAEWKQLVTYLGGESVAGGKLKETGTAHWYSPNTGATNETGFTALPGGYRYSFGNFSGVSYNGYWWSATELSTSYAWYWDMYYSYSSVVRKGDNKELGFSVRCLRD